MLIGPARGDALHVMTFNLRYASDTPPNEWSRRRPAMAELLRTERPTVLGTQEGLYAQLKDVQHDLPDRYDWIGVGRAGGSRDEFMAVFYDTVRLEPLEYDHFWLSETPGVIGSRSWASGSIRMVTWVRFADHRTRTEFVVLNTHLDNQSEQARVRGAELIRSRLDGIAMGQPIVVTGDFNAAAGASAPYDILAHGTGLTDTWNTATEWVTPAYATFHGYHPPAPHGARIDWILARGAVSVPAVAVNTFSRDGQFPSDHCPVQTLVTITTPR
ncbi:MAG TPA: endonuclease/exonuclease/phosphatase family protein [Actinophytocola sp.]|uniref:endonuclease/exonuclease/phosphatase family protein n=1 Tax=Actinophytocola sp. TaxID=1872138 RepID=UPI002DB9BE78|nr:endonuclease/exonuclease/phosphatase family protein [Actinophytocola sp.]HEU5472533.1 endonuclease/exonuclease/phosphatase family protein [Actinophytocola sp.]